MIMRKTMWLCIAAAAMTGQAWAEPEIKGTPGELAQYLSNVSKIVQIAGEGELKVYADQAEINLLVTVEEKSLKKAIEKYQSLCEKISQSLTDKGIAGDKIVPSKFMTTQDRDWLTSKTKEYRVTNSIRVSVTNQQGLEAVAEIVDAMDTVALGSIEFSHSQQEQMKLQVLTKALDQINAKKEIYEKKFNVRLKAHGFIEIAPMATTAKGGDELNRIPEEKSYPAKTESSWLSYVQRNIRFDEMVFVCRLMAEYQLKAE
jgi:uncharacterized protein YggE